MSLAEHFKDFCEDELPISESEFSRWHNRLKEITKKLNKKYLLQKKKSSLWSVLN